MKMNEIRVLLSINEGKFVNISIKPKADGDWEVVVWAEEEVVRRGSYSTLQQAASWLWAFMRGQRESNWGKVGVFCGNRTLSLSSSISESELISGLVKIFYEDDQRWMSIKADRVVINAKILDWNGDAAAFMQLRVEKGEEGYLFKVGQKSAEFRVVYGSVGDVAKAVMSFVRMLDEVEEGVETDLVLSNESEMRRIDAYELSEEKLEQVIDLLEVKTLMK